MENPVVEVDVTADPPGNPRVLLISFLAFSLGFAVWGMFSALAPFLIKWYNFSATQVLVLASMEPFFAAAISIPLGVLTDKFGGRTVFTLLLLSLSIPLFSGLFAQGYYSFLLLGSLLGLGGASFVVGNAHVSSWYPKSKNGTALASLLGQYRNHRRHDGRHFPCQSVGTCWSLAFDYPRPGRPGRLAPDIPDLRYFHTVDGAGLLVFYVRFAVQAAQRRFGT